MSSLPPFPKIDGDVDLMLDVYTHSSLRPGPLQMNDNYGDTLRLEDLGTQVFNLAVTVHLHNERPVLSYEEIRASRSILIIALLTGPQQTKKAQLTSFACLDAWLDSYQLKRKLRITPTEASAVLSDPVVNKITSNDILALILWFRR